MLRLLVIVAATAAFGAPALAQPSPVPSPSPAVVACDVAFGDYSLPHRDVFAHDLSDAPTLRFLARLAAVPDKAQGALFHKIATSSPDVSERIRAAVVKRCPGMETAYRSRRAIYTVANFWNFAEDDPLAPPFLNRLIAAVAALELRDSLPPADVDGALQPFDLHASDLLSGGGALVDSKPCAQPNKDAATLKVFQPLYPERAQTTRTVGVIQAKVSLSDEGFVRSVTVYKETGTGPALDELADMTLFSAGLTSYSPEVAACKPVAASYIFRADYVGK
jgi:hypothetical protein